MPAAIRKQATATSIPPIDIAVRITRGFDLRETRERFIDVLKRHCAELDGSKVNFSHLESEPYTQAGKRQYVLREPAPAPTLR